MKIGIFGVISHQNIHPREIAIEVEKRGFEAFYTGEHYHLPTATPRPDFYEQIPEYYKAVPEPFQVFSLMAGVTSKLKFGTTICIVPIHDPLMLATQIGTLDYLSAGRCQMIGMGVGWNQEELANHGVEFATRQERLREVVLAMKQLWRDEPARYEGTHVRFTECWSGPKPVQKPHPPLLLGGRPLKKNFRSIAEFCDGWIPTDTYAKTYGADLPKELETLNGMVRDAGRDPQSLQHLMFLAETGLYDRDPSKYAKEGPSRDELAGYEKLGFARVAIGVPTFSREHFLGALEHVERIAAPWLDR